MPPWYFDIPPAPRLTETWFSIIDNSIRYSSPVWEEKIKLSLISSYPGCVHEALIELVNHILAEDQDQGSCSNS
jgi:hypothetical protein